MACSICSWSGAYPSHVADGGEDRDGARADVLTICSARCSRDARQLPHVTRVANPYEFPDAPPPSLTASLGAGAESGGESSKTNVLPSEEWRETFLRRFKNFRKVRNDMSDNRLRLATPSARPRLSSACLCAKG